LRALAILLFVVIGDEGYRHWRSGTAVAALGGIAEVSSLQRHRLAVSLLIAGKVKR